MPEYTTDEAAALLQTARRNVQNYCKRHSLPKFGKQYKITDADIEAMREELGKVGRKAASTEKPISVATNVAQSGDSGDIPQHKA